MTQETALKILKTGASAFITGEPGSGKTHLVRSYVEWLRSKGIEPAITASTGIAATHIGGLTIHSWCGIGIKEGLTGHDLKKISENRNVVKRVRGASILIIDEISMLSVGTLGMVDAVCRSVRQSPGPFGGLQVVLVGDFFQLPPISKKKTPIEHQEELFETDNYSTGFAFNSLVWKELDPAVCYISEQHRQADKKFLGLLSAIRKNEIGEEHYELLRSRMVSSYAGEATKLFSRNINVDEINIRELSKLKEKVHVFNMETSGTKPLVDTLIRGCLSPETLSLKVGAKVMFTKNDQGGRYVNGTLGVVERFAGEDNNPVIKTNSGKTIIAEIEEWHIEDAGTILARINQYPLRLAWAITIHKSQGMSLDSAYMDLSDTFEYGQGYVALSRVRTFEGLHLRGFNDRSLEVHPEVSEKDGKFVNLSILEEKRIKETPEDELEQLQKEFIRACGGHKAAQRKASAKSSADPWEPEGNVEEYSVRELLGFGED